jgi:hypothetical protein
MVYQVRIGMSGTIQEHVYKIISESMDEAEFKAGVRHSHRKESNQDEHVQYIATSILEA